MLSEKSVQIRGRWNNRIYRLERLLGEGGGGQVYIAVHDGIRYALKLGNHSFDLLSEINVLQKVCKAQGNFLGPSLYDVDDTQIDGKWTSFYVMEWIQGETLRAHVQSEALSPGRAAEIVSCLLTALDAIHRMGYCFGDLKPENVVIRRQDGIPILIDFGGVTPFGHSVRQFTEEYDRGTWRAGLRKAEPAYDLFAVGMMALELLTGRKVWRTNNTSARRLSSIYDIIRRQKYLRVYQSVFHKAFTGKYRTAQDMNSDWLVCSRQREGKKDTRWIPALFWCSCALFVISLVVYGS